MNRSVTWFGSPGTAEFEGELPRLFVSSRQAQVATTDSGERANLEQAGLHVVLLQVISAGDIRCCAPP